MTDAVDRNALRRRLDATALDRLRISAQSGFVFGALALPIFWIAHPAAAPLLTAISIVGLIASGVLWFMIARRRVPEAWASAIGSGLWAIGVVVTVVGFVQTRSTTFSVLASVLTLSTVSLQIYRRWVLACAAFMLALWLPVGFGMLGLEFVTQGAVLVAVWVIGFIAHDLVVKYFLDLELLRHRDLAHQRERERLQDQLVHAQKLEAVGTLAGGIAHDMNNVLAAIIGLGELLRDDVAESSVADVDEILESARRGAELTRNLLAFSRRGNYRSAGFTVATMVQSVVKLLGRTLPKTVTLTIGELEQRTPFVVGDSAQLSHALINLCINASDAMDGVGALRIDVEVIALDEAGARALEVKPGDYVRLAVTDNGCGMTPDVKARVFEPFFTTKALGRGTGLGLSMVYGTAKRHDGAVTVDSELGRGTTILLYLPAVTAPSALGTEVPSRELRTRGSGMVMVVDDEPAVQSATRRSLERAGYDVVCAWNGAEAVELYTSRRDEIDLVVLDMAMPVMGGAECFAKLKALAPAVKVILASGFTREGDARACLDGGALAFLEKPYAPQRLLELVAVALRGDAPPADAGTANCAIAASR